MRLTSNSIAILSAIAVLVNIPQVYAQTSPPIESPQGNASDSLNQGLKKSNTGDSQGALAEYTQAIRLNPSYSLAYYNRAITYYDLGNKEAALADYNKAIQINQNWGQGAIVDAYINRGQLRDEMGDYKGSLADYNQAVSINPQDSEAYYNRGIVQQNMGDKKAAIADYTKAIKVNNWTDKGSYSAYLNRGNVKLLMQDRQGALEDYNQAIALKKDYAIAYKNRGILYLNTKKADQGIQDLQKAAQLFQQQGHQNRYDQVVQILKEVQR